MHSIRLQGDQVWQSKFYKPISPQNLDHKMWELEGVRADMHKAEIIEGLPARYQTKVVTQDCGKIRYISKSPFPHLECSFCGAGAVWVRAVFLRYKWNHACRHAPRRSHKPLGANHVPGRKVPGTVLFRRMAFKYIKGRSCFGQRILAMLRASKTTASRNARSL